MKAMTKAEAEREIREITGHDTAEVWVYRRDYGWPWRARIEGMTKVTLRHIVTEGRTRSDALRGLVGAVREIVKHGH